MSASTNRPAGALAAAIAIAILIGPAGAEPVSRTAELTIDDLRGPMPQIDALLAEAGYTGDPADLVLQVKSSGDDSEPPEFNLIERSPRRIPAANYKYKYKRQRNFLLAGIVYSLAYWQGVSLNYHVANRRHDKISWGFEADVFQHKDFEALSLAINKYVGHKGLYVGAVASGSRFTVEYIEGSPPVEIGFVGAHLGWEHAWGRTDRVVTKIEGGVEGVQYEFKNLIMPDARVGIGIRLNNVKRKVVRSNRWR